MDLFDKYTADETLVAVEYDCGETGLGLFETYGDDLETVRKIAETDLRRVWTLMDADDGSTIWYNGFWRVNRILYAVTKEHGEEHEQFTCLDNDDFNEEDNDE